MARSPLYVVEKLNRFVIPRIELTYLGHLAKMHQNAAPALVAILQPMNRA